MKAGMQWPLMIVSFLGVNIAICAFTIYSALSDRSHKVEDNYDYKALRFDETIRQREFNRSLGWKLAIDVQPSADVGADEARPAATTITSIVLSDGSGLPIKNARILCETFHEARPAHVLTPEFTGTHDGRYSAPVDMDRAGLWRFRFVVDAMGMRFTDEQVVPVLDAADTTG